MDAFAVPPPGRVPGFIPPSPARLRPLATALTVLFCVIGLVVLAVALMLFFRGWLVAKTIDGPMMSATTANAVDTTVTVLVTLQLVLTVAVATVFIVWQVRHARNAQVLGFRGELGPGWAVGGWFLPGANFVIPAVQIFGSSRHSDPAAAARPDRRGRGLAIVAVWAAAFGIGALMSTFPVFPDSSEPEQLARQIAAADQLGGIGGLILTVAAVLAMIMVRVLSTRQERALAAAGVSVGPSAPSWAASGQPPWPSSGQPTWATPPVGAPAAGPPAASAGSTPAPTGYPSQPAGLPPTRHVDAAVTQPVMPPPPPPPTTRTTASGVAGSPPPDAAPAHEGPGHDGLGHDEASNDDDAPEPPSAPPAPAPPPL